MNKVKSSPYILVLATILLFFSGCNKNIPTKKELLDQIEKDQTKISELRERVRLNGNGWNSCRKRVESLKSSMGEVGYLLEYFGEDEGKLLQEFQQLNVDYTKRNIGEYRKGLSNLQEKYSSTKMIPYILYFVANAYEDMYYDNNETADKHELRNETYDLYKKVITDYPDSVFYKSEKKKQDGECGDVYSQAQKGWRLAIIAQFKICKMYICPENYFVNIEYIDELKHLINLLEDEKDKDLIKLSVASRLEVLNNISDEKQLPIPKNRKLIEEYSDYLLAKDNTMYVGICEPGMLGFSHPEAYLALISKCKYEKNFKMAKYYRDIILSDYSENRTAKCHSDMIYYYIWMVLPESVEELIEIVKSDFPPRSHVEAQAKLIKVYEKQKEYDKAIEICEDIINEKLEVETMVPGEGYYFDRMKIELARIKRLKADSEK